MELELVLPDFYRVKRGQTLATIAKTFGLPPRVLADCNRLTQEPPEGFVLAVPAERRDLYVVRGGESKKLLCGSDEAFEQRNRTPCLFPGQIVWL